jgi:hypothetical protein
LEAGPHASSGYSSHGGCGGGGGLINRTQFLEPKRCVNMTRRALSPCVSVGRSRARNNKHRSSYPLSLSQLLSNLQSK